MKSQMYNRSPLDGTLFRKAREIRKPVCEVCNGRGSITNFKEQSCPHCSGNGWALSEDKQEIVCPVCKGDGTATVKVADECKECGGRGYSIRVVEILDKPIDGCPECQGIGYGLVDRECTSCDGTGIEPDTEVCELCLGARNIDGWKCPRCEGQNERSLVGCV